MVIIVFNLMYSLIIHIKAHMAMKKAVKQYISVRGINPKDVSYKIRKD